MFTQITIQILLLLLGFAILGWGADILITGASSVAKRFGISPLIIGLTIIALGTSLPEIVISFISAIRGHPEIAVGNAIGSNITNIGLVLGVTALLIPLKLRSGTLRKELPLLFLIMLLVGTLMLDDVLSQLDGLMLMTGAIVFILWLIYQGTIKQRKKTPLETEYRKEIPKKSSIIKAIIQVMIGLIILPLASRLIVDNATFIAKLFHVSDLIIGLTIVAIGTSLPELATSIAGARRKEYDIVIGNVIGSNIFNLLAVLGIPAIIKPIILQKHILYRDFAFMIGITILLYIFSFGLKGKGKAETTRWEGAFLVLAYIAYLISLCFIH